MTRASNLGLGTVQFGQDYGVSNSRGRVPRSEADAILRRAAAAGMTVLDTAAEYGQAEETLGSLRGLTKPFRIVTKTIPLKNGLDAVFSRARQSVETLEHRPVDLLLVHSARDLRCDGAEKLWSGLLALRDEGLFGAIGISAYVADDPVSLARKYRPAAMQIPLSLLDQRLLRSGALAAVKDTRDRIHARSLFLQGLLFVDEAGLPEKLKPAAPHLMSLRQRLKEVGTTPLAAALAFVLNRPEVDVGIVGVTALSELEEILTASAMSVPDFDWGTCALDDLMLLTPSLW